MHLKCPRCSFTYIFCKILSVELTSVKQEDISGSDQEDARFLQPFVVFILSLVILTPPPSPSLSLRATFYAFIDLCLYITHLRHMTNIYYKYEHKKLTSFYECARTLLFPEITCEMFFMYSFNIALYIRKCNLCYHSEKHGSFFTRKCSQWTGVMALVPSTNCPHGDTDLCCFDLLYAFKMFHLTDDCFIDRPLCLSSCHQLPHSLSFSAKYPPIWVALN